MGRDPDDAARTTERGEAVPRVGVVVPAYKESENIAALIGEIVRHVPNADIVVVDDSPDDATASAARALGLANVTVIHRTAKGGRGSAVMDGLQALAARGYAQIVEMDADFSHPPTQLPALLHEARARRLDLLIASRYLRSSRIENWPTERLVFSRGSNKLARLVLGVPIADYTNGYRIYSRAAAELILATCGKLGKGFIPLSEILVNLHYRGFAIGETPTVFTNRLRGESSVNMEELKNAAVGLVKIYLLKRSLKAL